MRCVFCDKSVIGVGNVVTIQGGAPAHLDCHKFQLMSQRVFKGIKLTTLSDSELTELSDLVKQEMNSRAPQMDAVELF